MGGREVLLKIEDNGQDFSLADAQKTRRHRPSGGFGLIGMVERVWLLGGVYTLDSVPKATWLKTARRRMSSIA